MKLVVSFANEEKHIDSYKKVAKKTMKLGQFSAVVTGAYVGLFFGSAIGFSVFSWFLGGILISKQYINPTTGAFYTVADIITVYQAELYGLMTFASMLPVLPGVERALGVGYKVFELIERKPEIRTPEDPEEVCETIEI